MLREAIPVLIIVAMIGRMPIKLAQYHVPVEKIQNAEESQSPEPLQLKSTPQTAEQSALEEAALAVVARLELQTESQTQTRPCPARQSIGSQW